MAEEIYEDMETGEQSNKNLFPILGIMLLIIVLIGSYLMLSSQNIENTTDSEDEQREFMNPGDQTQTTAGMLMGNNAIYATASADDNTVHAVQVILENNGYVVIHEDNNGSPGRVLAHSELITSGQVTNLQIPLEEDIQEGQTLYAMLHQDDGDGEFEFPDADEPLLFEDNQPIMMIITVDGPNSDEQIML